MRLIDADVLIDKTDDKYSLGEIGRRERDDIVDALEFAPTIDAVEVVRCGECKHYSVEGETTRFGWCGYWNKPTDEMRYCSDGEREGE